VERLPVSGMNLRLGTVFATSSEFSIWNFSSASGVSAVTATGVVCSRSSRRSAVTTISPRPASSLPEAGAASAVPPTPQSVASTAARVMFVFIVVPRLRTKARVRQIVRAGPLSAARAKCAMPGAWSRVGVIRRMSASRAFNARSTCGSRERHDGPIARIPSE
jgi:hypothetical protein